MMMMMMMMMKKKKMMDGSCWDGQELEMSRDETATGDGTGDKEASAWMRA